MHDVITRRDFTALLGLAAAGTATLRAAPAAATPGGHTEFRSLRQVDAGPLTVGYAEDGPADGPVVILLHGWPYDIHAYLDVAPMLADSGFRVIVPYVRGFGSTTFRSADAMRNGQQAAVAGDVVDLMDALGIPDAILAGFDWGSRSAAIVAALWPQRCRGLVAVSGYLVVDRAAQRLPLAPRAEYGWWYQYYFATERGERGYRDNTRDFNELIWRQASPQWSFDEATYARSAAASANPDHVAVVVHNYRWRLGRADGERRYDELERRLAARPPITVPTITVASDFDGPARDGAGYRASFTGRYAHRVLDGIGHDVPQEAPRQFADAVVDVAGWAAG